MEFDVRASGITLCYAVPNSANIDINILRWNRIQPKCKPTEKKKRRKNRNDIEERWNEVRAVKRNVRDIYMYLCQKENVFFSFCDIPKHARKHSAHILIETHTDSTHQIVIIAIEPEARAKQLKIQECKEKWHFSPMSNTATRMTTTTMETRKKKRTKSIIIIKIKVVHLSSGEMLFSFQFFFFSFIYHTGYLKIFSHSLSLFFHLFNFSACVYRVLSFMLGAVFSLSVENLLCFLCTFFVRLACCDEIATRTNHTEKKKKRMCLVWKFI